MVRYLGAMAIMATMLFVAACGADDGGGSGDTGNGSDGNQESGKRVHSKILISEFERDNSTATREFGDKYVTVESFVDKHNSDEVGTYVRLKSEPFATRFIFCYYDPAVQLDIPDLESESVVFMNGRVGEFQDIFLRMYDCSTAAVDTAGGGIKSGSTHLDDQK
jgi:hypothetical protein